MNLDLKLLTDELAELQHDLSVVKNIEIILHIKKRIRVVEEAIKLATSGY